MAGIPGFIHEVFTEPGKRAKSFSIYTKKKIKPRFVFALCYAQTYISAKQSERASFFSVSSRLTHGLLFTHTSSCIFPFSSGEKKLLTLHSLSNDIKTLPGDKHIFILGRKE